MDDHDAQQIELINETTADWDLQGWVRGDL